MRPLVIITAVVVLAALAAGQEVSRRERLRNLISAARGGDLEARKALRSLRDKLRKRTETAEAPVVQQPAEPEVQPEQQTVDIIEPRVESPVETFPQSQPVRQHPRERSRIVLDPHRALNRGLEVDSRSEANAVIRVTNQTRTPPIQTLRRYSYFDEQGNYIFGYEAADGSFKEEKRGLDCIVHGKYGYVDPDGVRREYTYVSGNRCDHNEPREEGPQTERVLNNQFLEETLSDPAPIRTSEPALPRIRSQASRRRRPIGVQQPQVQPETVNIPNEITEQLSVSEPQVEVLQKEIIPESRPVQPEPVPEKPVVVTPKTVIPHFQIKAAEPVVPIFRPTPKPIDFDFDREFKNLFSHFGISRPRAQVIPSPVKPQFTPRPSPPPPPPPKVIITEKPVTVKSKPVLSQPKPANVAHQLIFDSATGTFKTVPFTVIPVSFPKASGTSAKDNPIVTGKPLSLTGFNPLPSVPIGSLSFKGPTAVSAAQFDNFFNQFRIN